MARVYSWESFIEIHKEKNDVVCEAFIQKHCEELVWEAFIQEHGEIEGARSCFEYACADLLYHEAGSRVHWIRSAGGDGGIDVCVENDDNTFDIYQCKFFPPRLGELDSSRWRQAKDSFTTLEKNQGIRAKHWYLCMPRNLTERELKVFNKFKEDKSNTGICIEFIEGTHLISRMRDAGIADRWFGITTYTDSSEPGSPHQRPSLNEIKSIRRLADGIWINWKTRCLTKDYASALTIPKTDDKKLTAQPQDSPARSEGLIARLDAAQLRLLSVLVQGEGAVVSREELYRRGVVMQREMEPERYGDDLIDRSTGFARDKDVNETRAEAENAIRELVDAAPVLETIIKRAENDKGLRIRLSGAGSKSADSSTNKERRAAEKVEWNRLSAPECKKPFQERENPYSDTVIWLSRYYADICDSFENRVSNSGDNVESKEGDVFGDYKMIDAYSNAYVVPKGSDKTVAMLDFVEKWYYGGRLGIREAKAGGRYGSDEDDEAQYGRVLVIHGQPGDGKTTFCKKAVYAHRYEGWLGDVPEVLRISLNPNDGGRTIVMDDKLNLPAAFCLYRSGKNERYYCDPTDLPEGSLIIFDGYDELSGDLAKVEDASTFKKFYKRVEDFAKDCYCNVIITSRTMCIEREIDDSWAVAAFAPMTIAQQDLLIERMAELDREREGNVDGKAETVGRRMDLPTYQQRVLPRLRAKPKLNELLVIPILFRMIVNLRFEDANEAENAAQLYSDLFHTLMEYKDRDVEQVKQLIGEYEEIAVKIFNNYDNDTCIFDKKLDGDRELVYLFLTKSGQEEGQMGFLHRAFYQYFLASYFVSRIQEITTERPVFPTAEIEKRNEKSRERFMHLFRSLRATRVFDPVVWQLVGQIAAMRGRKKESFEEKVELENIKAVLSYLNEEAAYVECMKGTAGYPLGLKAEQSILPAAENAVFNLISSLAAAEKGIHRAAYDEHGENPNEQSITYGGEHGYENVCALLRRGDYADIYLENVNLSNCDLKGVRMDGAHLSGARLEGAELAGASLEGADMKGASLEGAELKGANFKKSILRGASLRGGYLEGTDFNKADMAETQLELALLDEADLTEANLSYSVLDNASLLRTRLVRARLDHARLLGADLRQADLRRAKMDLCSFDGTYTDEKAFQGGNDAGALGKGEKTNLSEANLSGTVLRGAHLQKVHMEGADFSWADVTRAVLRDAFLVGADFHGACLVGAHLEGAHMEWASFESAVIWDAHLEAVHYSGSNMGRSVIDGTCLRDTDITGAYMSKEMYQYAKTAGAVGKPLLTENGDMIQSRSLIIGETIQYGRYWQRTAEEKEPLEWRVLARKKGSVLLITERLIDCRQYHHDLANITWEYCDLRRWMNEDFIHEAFSGAELARIAWRETANPDNDRYDTEGGNATWDRIFALSIDEAERYFKNDDDRMAAVTPYAKAKGSYANSGYHLPGGEPTGWWWLRSPGGNGDIASYVDTDGGVDRYGGGVGYGDVSVRPALWLNL